MERLSLNSGKDYLDYREGSGGTVEIFDIAVNSERKQGRGKQLIEMLKEKVDTPLIWAITRESNIGAHAFYEHCGFRLIARLDKFYRWQEEWEDARIYGLEQ